MRCFIVARRGQSLSVSPYSPCFRFRRSKGVAAGARVLQASVFDARCTVRYYCPDQIFTMAYMTHCCCGCMTVRTGTKVLAILSVIGFALGLVSYSAVCTNFDKILELYKQYEELYDAVKSSYGLFVAYAVISAIGLVAACLCIRGAYTDQRHLLLPYLAFEGLMLVVQAVVIIIVIVVIVATGATQFLMLLCALMVSLALQIYFLMVVLSFYKQLAFISENPGQVGTTPGAILVPSGYVAQPGYPAAPPQYPPQYQPQYPPSAPDTKMGMV